MAWIIGCDEEPDNATLWPTAFFSKSLLSAEWNYNNIEQENPGILHSPEKFHHYCFAKNICIITDLKPLVTIISEDVATLSQHLQCIKLSIHLYRIHIMYKPGPDLYVADWLSQNNHTENRDQEITGMNVNMNATNVLVNIPRCTSTEDIKVASWQEEDLQRLKSYIIHSWPQKRWSGTEHEALLTK